MDFRGHFDTLRLRFELLHVILAWSFSPKCVCHFSFALHFVVLQMLWIFILVSIRDIFFTVLGVANQKVNYCCSHFHFRLAINHNISHGHRYAILRFAHCSMISMSMTGCAWIDMEYLRPDIEGDVQCSPYYQSHSCREMSNQQRRSGSQNGSAPPPNMGDALQHPDKRIERVRSAREILVYEYRQTFNFRLIKFHLALLFPPLPKLKVLNINLGLWVKDNGCKIIMHSFRRHVE